MALTPPNVSLSLTSLTSGPFRNRQKSSTPPWEVHFVNTTSGDYLDKTRWTLTVGEVGFAYEARLGLKPGSNDEIALLQQGKTLILTIVYSNGDTDEVSVSLAVS